MSKLLAESLAEHIDACFTGLWIQTYEPVDTLQEIVRLCHRRAWRLAVWDVDQGVSFPGADSEAALPTGSGDPLAAIRTLGTLANAAGSSLLVLRNFHRFLGSAEIVQALEHRLHQGKQDRTFVVVLAPLVQIPVELEKQFVVLEHELPTKEQLHEIARGVATEAGELPEDRQLAGLLEAASGLTRSEAEAAFSLSLVQHGRLQPDTLWDLKGQALKKSGLLTLHRGRETFADLGGLASLKGFCLRALRSRATTDARTQPRGIFLLSAPGCGKSAFCKALGRETDRPTLILDIGTLLGGIVGQTEQNVRQALKIVDAMGRCILMLDEVDKSLSGVAASGPTDSGVSARLFGTLLNWLSDHHSEVFVVCCANDVSRLPPEFTRAERFDGVFFLDLPDADERRGIWDLYLPQFGLEPQQALPDDTDWTGAEIRSCCRLAALLDLPLLEAARQIVPVARTAAESVDRLRTWASGRCLSAQTRGIYQRKGKASAAGRRVNRPHPSQN